jgi:alpha-beta hydrolase superfamily lysophospholipase
MNPSPTPVPASSSLTTADGLGLHGQAWPLPGRPARGSVVIVHGLGEHIARHAALAAQLNAWGWQVAGFDQRGHGRSEGPRGSLANEDDPLRDLAQVIDATRTAWPGPLVLLGHSMGGLVAARFVAEGLQESPASWSRAVDALVLSSPALDPGMNAGQKLLLAVLGRLAPGLAVGNGLEPAWISRDADVVAAYVADPLVHDRVTPRLARFILDGGAFVRGVAPRWAVPTLLLWAGSDRCVAPSGSAAFAAAAPKDVVQAQVFASLSHEIFNEPEKDVVFEALGAWLTARGQ